MSDILYEVRDSTALITLNRPQASNAQSAGLLRELDEAFARATADRDIAVIVLAAAGKHFSAGHDMSQTAVANEPWSSLFDRVDETGLLDMYDWETGHYLAYAKRWRDIPKPTIAAVQGACVAAGLMLAWPMDLIIAADDARFSDPVVRLGANGVEYHAHAWEFGARKAKELLFTAGWIDAAEAQRLGMVNRVVPREALLDEALALAAKIGEMPPQALRMAKRSVNAALDAMGQPAAINHAFDAHSWCHANAWIVHGQPVVASLSDMKEHRQK